MSATLIPNSRVYTDCEKNGFKFKAVRTKICQETGESIAVEFQEAGESINEYSESLSVAASATTTIIDYTVAALKELRLKRIDFSGTNRGVYTIEINSTTEAKKRTYYTKLEDYFVFEDLKLNPGDNLKLIVENKNTNMTGDFNANLQGNLRDA
jgi:hypothetical protein